MTYSAPVYCDGSPPQYSCGLQALVKLSASDGSIAWQFNNTGSPIESGQVFPQAAVLQDADVLVGGPFYGPYSTDTLLRLSGVDGSVQWSATLPSFTGNQVSGIFPGTSSIIVVGSGWAEIDAATGQVLWANPANNLSTCANPCYTYANLRMASDDILFGGENGGHATVTLLPATQGSQTENFSLYSEGTGFRSLVNQIVQDSANGVWLEIRRQYRGGNAGILLLAQFDPSSGTLLSSQAIAPYDDSGVANTNQPLLMGAPENNQVLVQTAPYQAGMPDTTGNALINTAITANGDLALTATADQLAITAGQTVTFHFTVTYSGDAPISGAHLLADLPWPGTPANVTCTTQSASNCVLDTLSDVLGASFDMQPGGQVSISGQVVVASTSGTPMLQGVVYGPTSLNELNTTNNFGYLSLSDEIFANGFEQSQQ